MTETAVIEK